MNDTDRYIVVLEMYAKDDETKAKVGKKLQAHFQENPIIFSVQEIEYKAEVTRFKVVCCGLSQNEYHTFIKFVIDNEWRPITEWFVEQYRAPAKRGRKKKKTSNIVIFDPPRSRIPKSTLLFSKQKANKDASLEKQTID